MEKTHNEKLADELGKTGEYKITMKQNAETAGRTKMRAPGVFMKGEDGTILHMGNVIIGNGSIGTISFDTYNWEYNGKKGKSMSLKNVLVTNLVQFEVAEPAGAEFGKLNAGSEFDADASPFKDEPDLDLDLDFAEDDDF